MRIAAAPVLLSLVIIFVPVYLWGERALGDAWDTRALVSTFDAEPAADTPHLTSGTLLPTTIDQDLTFLATDNPLLVSGTTVISESASLTLGPGVVVVAGEHAGLDVLGSFTAEGTADEPILFRSNMQHPDDQSWSGIIARPDSRVRLKHAMFDHAAPALSCLEGSDVMGESVRIVAQLVGTYAESVPCLLLNSTVHAGEPEVLVTRERK